MFTTLGQLSLRPVALILAAVLRLDGLSAGQEALADRGRSARVCQGVQGHEAKITEAALWLLIGSSVA
jgi:hypothetical protein